MGRGVGGGFRPLECLHSAQAAGACSHLKRTDSPATRDPCLAVGSVTCGKEGWFGAFPEDRKYLLQNGLPSCPGAVPSNSLSLGLYKPTSHSLYLTFPVHELDERTVLYPYNGMLFGHEKRCHNTHEHTPGERSHRPCLV